MKRLVLDCSVAMAWCFKDEATPFTESVLDSLMEGEAVVPAIWPLEVANVLLVAERRRRLTAADSVRCLALLGSLPIVVDNEMSLRSMDRLMTLARGRQLSSYDAAYLELAAKKALPLATVDRKLIAACRGFGVEILE